MLEEGPLGGWAGAPRRKAGALLCGVRVGPLFTCLRHASWWLTDGHLLVPVFPLILSLSGYQTAAGNGCQALEEATRDVSWSFVQRRKAGGREEGVLEKVAPKPGLERQERKGLLECVPLICHERHVKWG